MFRKILLSLVYLFVLPFGFAGMAASIYPNEDFSLTSFAMGMGLMMALFGIGNIWLEE